MALRIFQYCFETSASMSSQLKAHGKALLYCKSESGNAGYYHQHTLTAGSVSETCIFLDDVTSPILKPTSSGTWCHFVFDIALLIGPEKSDAWAVCTWFQHAKSDNLYLIVTNFLERSILVSLTGSLWNVFHLHPKQFNQAMDVSLAEPSIGENGREYRATFVYWVRKKDVYSPRRGYREAILMFSKRTKTF